MRIEPLYFFAIRTDQGWEIDSVARELDASAVYEHAEVANGLIAWDDEGRSYEFEPLRDREGAAWQYCSRSHDVEELREALRRFLYYILKSKRHRRRARSAAVDVARLDAASVQELVDTARRMDLIGEY